MKYSLLFVALLTASASFAEEIMQIQNIQDMEAPSNIIQDSMMDFPAEESNQVLTQNVDIRISVTGQGVAPMNTVSPAQSYAMAKRAAIADGYRLIAEKVKGVHVDGQDTIKNMMVKRSTVRTAVNAMIKNANVVETTFKEGLCEVEMEIMLSHSQFAQ
jgi:hypothetical protein